METVGQVRSLNLTRAVEGEFSMNAARFFAILDLTLAEVGGDSRPSMQSEPY